MEIILLGIYAFFVWLIFIKFKLLPWTTPYKVAVAIIPVVGLMTLMLLLNVFAPTTDDVRVIKYIVPVVSQVRGRVIEVPVANNRPVKKGDVLFRIDPTPYQNESTRSRRSWSPTKRRSAPIASVSASQGGADRRAGVSVSWEQLNQATGQGDR